MRRKKYSKLRMEQYKERKRLSIYNGMHFKQLISIQTSEPLCNKF